PPSPLLRPGVGPQDDLPRLGIGPVVDLPGVGRNLQDHIWLHGLCFEAKHPRPVPNNNLGGSLSFWRSRPALCRPDLMVLATQVPLVSDDFAAQHPIPPTTFAIIPTLVPPHTPASL